jgi:hypothetical protein
MKTIYKTSLPLVICCTVIGFSAHTAMATNYGMCTPGETACTPNFSRVAAGISGMADTTSEASCFGGYWNGVINNCSTTQRWDVPIPVDISYGLTMDPSAQLKVNGEAANVSCQAQAASWDFTAFSTTGWQPAGTVSQGGPVNPGLGNITVPYSNNEGTIPGTASVACFLTPGTVFGGVQY